MGIIPSFVAYLERKAFAGGLLASLYSRNYIEVIQKEIALAGITSQDRVLNVGCGGIPYTALQIAKCTGARVWAIDRDKESVRSAGRCIQSMEMEDMITVLNMDGTGNIFFKFDVAIVALQSEPKRAILDNLIQRAETGARLVFRRPRAKFSSQYDSLPDVPVPTAETIQYKATFDSSVLYKVTKDKVSESSGYGDFKGKVASL